MTGLLDTHTLIWAADDPAQLSAVAATFIRDPGNTILLSTASVWELVIKLQTGKLQIGRPLRAVLAALPGLNVTVLPIRADHALAVEGLPTAHKDPFDRMLAAQAIVEGAALITIDKIFQQYPVTVVW